MLQTNGKYKYFLDSRDFNDIFDFNDVRTRHYFVIGKMLNRTRIDNQICEIYRSQKAIDLLRRKISH